MGEFDVDAEYRAAIRETTEWGDLLRLGLDLGIAGNGSGTVQVPGRTGWIYVRRPDSSDVFEARNRLGFSPMEDDPLLIKKDKRRGYEVWEVVSVDISAMVYAQVMFCVPGALSVVDDIACWFRCSAPGGIQILWVILMVKIAPSGGPVTCDIELSEDNAGTWNTIFGGGVLPSIPDGSKCGAVQLLVASDTTTIAQGDILRLNSDAANGAEWLVASLGVRQL